MMLVMDQRINQNPIGGKADESKTGHCNSGEESGRFRGISSRGYCLGNHHYALWEVQGMTTILGQNISLIRPARIVRHSASGAWRGAKKAGRKTRKLTLSEKNLIAWAMGYKLKELA